MGMSTWCAHLMATLLACAVLISDSVAQSRRQLQELKDSLSALGARDLQTCTNVLDALDRDCFGYVDDLYVKVRAPLHVSLTDVDEAVNILKSDSSCDQKALGSAVRPIKYVLRLLHRSASVVKRRICNASDQQLSRAKLSVIEEKFTNAQTRLKAFAEGNAKSVILNRTLLCTLSGDTAPTNENMQSATALHLISRAQNGTLALLPKLEYTFQRLARLLDAVGGSSTGRNGSGVLHLLHAHLLKKIRPTLDNLSLSGVISTKDINQSVRSTRFVVCTAFFSGAVDRKPCPWHCKHSSLLVNLADHVSSGSEVDSDPAFTLLAYVAVQCADDSVWHACLDFPCNNTRGVCTVTNTSEIARTHARTRQTCFRTRCPRPLLQTKTKANWDKEVQETLRHLYRVSSALFPERTFNDSALPCGVQCDSLSFGEDAERTTRIVISIFAWPLFFTSLFTLISFCLSRDQYQRYPTSILFYLYVLIFLATITLLVQNVVDQRTFTCNPDGTVRTKEPKALASGGSPTCVIIFVVSSFCYLAAICWWLALTHGWYVTLASLDVHHGQRDRSRANYMKMYHVFSWTVPAVVTAAMLGQHHVDGFSLYGICMSMDSDIQFYYYSIPQVAVSIVGLPLLVKGGICFYRQLQSMRRAHAKRLERSGSQRVLVDMRRFIFKLTILIIINVFATQVNFFSGAYVKANWKGWLDSRRRHLACALLSCTDDVSHCPPIAKPPLAVFLSTQLTMLLEGLVICTFMFNSSTVRAWKQRYASQRSRFLTSDGVPPPIRHLSSTFSISRKSRGSYEQSSTCCKNKRSPAAVTTRTLSGGVIRPTRGPEQEQVYNTAADSVKYIKNVDESTTRDTALLSSDEASSQSVSAQSHSEMNTATGEPAGCSPMLPAGDCNSLPTQANPINENAIKPDVHVVVQTTTSV